MLARTNRLVKTKDIERTFKQGKSFFGKNLGAKIVVNEFGVSRFAIVVSTKVSKKAVVRNKIKRRLREVLRLEKDYLKTGYDLVLIALPTIVDVKQLELKGEIVKILQRAKLYQ
jgi:ribonuclease P protein component